jgi:ABC-type transport system involved in multi-copper enzyme maturation permease subunit
MSRPLADSVAAPPIAKADLATQGSARQRIVAISRNSFREAVRDRVLYNLVIFALLLIGGAIFLGELSAGQEAKIIVDLGLSAILLFGVFIAIFVGVGLVYKEIERRTLYAILSKPVARGEFLIGKYLGLCLTLLVNVVIMGAGLSLAVIWVKRGWDPLVTVIWPAVLLIYIELMILTGVAMLFSSFSSPALSALLTFFIFVIGHLSSDLKSLSQTSASMPSRWLFAGVYYLMPNLANYNAIAAAAHGVAPELRFILMMAAYGVMYIAALLAATTLVFRRKNLK